LGQLLLGKKGGEPSESLSGRGKAVVRNLVKGLVQANDLDDLIHFNKSKQAMILKRIKAKYSEFDISDDQLLEDVQKYIAEKDEREAAIAEKKRQLEEQANERNLDVLR
jgi:superfamily II DNA or RNA helicase